MKPFNLEEAKAGKPVCTREGRAARIICFEQRDEVYPLVVLVMVSHEKEQPYSYTRDGRIFSATTVHDYDLRMNTTTTTVWVNIYKGDAAITIGVFTYPTKEDAEEKSATDYKNGWLGAFPFTIEE